MSYIEKAEKLELPVVVLNGIVAFPGATVSFELTEDFAAKAAEAAFDTDSLILICTYKDSDEDIKLPDCLYKTGTVCKIKQSLKTADGVLRVVAEGYSRAAVPTLKS